MNQKGAVHLLILVAAIGILVFLSIAYFAPFGDKLLSSLFGKPSSRAAGVPWDSVPSITIPYGSDVETYWQSHPFNPASTNYRPDINSPANIVPLTSGASIQNAINNLPATGGTIKLAAGSYAGGFKIIGKSNVHIISDTNATITGGAPVVVAGCQEATIYHNAADGTLGIVSRVTNREPTAVACVTTNRIKNIYFKNLTFDGQNGLSAFSFHAAQDIVMDNLTFRNFKEEVIPPGNYVPHRGILNGNAVLQNIWIRGSVIEGAERYAAYLDGCHGCGVINSTINAEFTGGGFLFLVNDDMTRDYNQNGTVELPEQRMAQYVVVANNTFGNGSKTFYNLAQFSGRNNLVIGNIITKSVTSIAGVDSKASFIFTNFVYDYLGNKVIGNDARGGVTTGLAVFNGSPYISQNPPTCPPNPARFGQYTIKNNRALSGVSVPVVNNLICTAAVTGPNDVTGNCFGASCPAPSLAPAPSAAVSPSPAALQTGSADFPIGVFEDGNMTWGVVSRFTDMVADLKSKGLNAVMFVNNNFGRDDAMLSVSDSQNFNVYISGNAEAKSYLSDTTPTIEEARTAVYPLIDTYKLHSSVKGYNIVDEPTNDPANNQLQHVVNLVQAFKERDNSRPASPIFIGLNRGDTIYSASLPNAFFMDAYPFSVQSAACDFSMKGFGYPTYSLSSYIRQMTRNKPADQPLYLVLQTHNVGDSTWGIYELRVPTIAEIRGEHWIAVGEGAKGIFWFIYSSQQGWTGLKDSPALMAEISSLAQRTNPLKTILLDTNRNATDLFTVNNGGYISTLTSKDGTKKYAVVANIGSCSANQNLTISSSQNGQLKDLESGQTYTFGQAINFAPGDGKIFELVSSTASTAPTASASPISGGAGPNLLTNSSFDTATNWALGPSSTIDTTVSYSGGSSLKVSGLAEGYTRQIPTLKPDTTYSYSYWVKTQNVTGTGVWSRYVQLLPAVQYLVQTSAILGTNDWQKVTGTFTTPSNFTNGRFDLYYKLNSGDTAWFDDVILCEGANCLATASPSPLSSAGKVADISGNTGSSDGKVDIWDYNQILTDFGSTDPNSKSNIEKAGTSANKVDIFDYNLLLTHFGS